MSRSVVDATPGLVPVVKGNGYGFGREVAAVAAELADASPSAPSTSWTACPRGPTPIVLTPTLRRAGQHRAGPDRRIAASTSTRWLAGPGRVIVKLESSMHRYGGGIALVENAQLAGLRRSSVAIHPPLAGSDDATAPTSCARLAVDRSVPRRVGEPPRTRRRTPRSRRPTATSCGSAATSGTATSRRLRLEAVVMHTRPIGAGSRPATADAAARADGCAGDDRWRASAGGVHPLATVAARSTPSVAGWPCSSHPTCTRRWRSSRPATRAPRSATGSTCSDHSRRPSSTSCDGRDRHTSATPVATRSRAPGRTRVVRAVAMAGVVTMNFHGYLIIRRQPGAAWLAVRPVRPVDRARCRRASPPPSSSPPASASR